MPSTSPLKPDSKKIATVFVQGSFANSQTRRIFDERDRYTCVNNIHAADIVVWTGGEDVFPGHYGEKPIKGVYYNIPRDKDDIDAVADAEGKFLVGICRGAQLLHCIPNGGTLWQDVNGHEHCHHSVRDKITGEEVMVNSLHHQMLKITPELLEKGCEVIASSVRTTYKQGQDFTWSRAENCFKNTDDWMDINSDPEVVWWPKTRSLLVQYHPEFNHPSTTDYFFRLMSRYYWNEKQNN